MMMKEILCVMTLVYTVSETYIISSRYIYNHSGKISQVFALYLGTRCHLLSWDLGIVFDYFLLLLVDQKKITVSLRVRQRSKQYFAVLYQILHNCIFDERKSSYEKENYENHLPNTYFENIYSSNNQAIFVISI